VSREIILMENLKTTKNDIASSNLMATNMRKAAKRAGLDYKIQARGGVKLGDNVDQIAVLMLSSSFKDRIWCD
jgi:PTS system cellobiose-specific IIB component